MNDEIKAWFGKVEDWVGNSPKKAATFGAVVLLVGIFIGAVIW